MLDEALDGVRREASQLLAGIARESGPESALYRVCKRMWLDWEDSATLSMIYGDEENARVILERGVGVLRYGPLIVKHDGLPLEDALRLMDAE